MKCSKVVDKNGKVNGAVAVDYAGLTTGVRNSPYFDSFIFDGRLASFFITINYNDETVFTHPMKINQQNSESKNSITDLFRSEQEQTMITDVKSIKNGEILVRTFQNYKYTTDTADSITFYWRKSNVTGRF